MNLSSQLRPILRRGAPIIQRPPSEASLGPPRWVARVGWDRRGWLLVEERSEPALRRFAAPPRGWALVRTGLTDQACGHGCGGDGKTMCLTGMWISIWSVWIGFI